MIIRIKRWILKHDTEWLKWQIVKYADDKYDDACWANMCMWPLGFQTFRETFGEEGNWKEQTCDEEYGCYCGKCCKLGRLKWEDGV